MTHSLCQNRGWKNSSEEKVLKYRHVIVEETVIEEPKVYSVPPQSIKRENRIVSDSGCPSGAEI